jgi:hypothetical protein
MLIEAKSELAKDVKVVDFMGKEVAFVKSFDTETKEAELYIANRDNKVTVIKDGSEASPTMGQVLIVKVSLPGCKAINKRTGEEVK